MEFRYVYRRVEDAIGSGIEVADSPHGRLTLQLRHLFREQRDLSRHTELIAMCMASLAGNSRIDIRQVSDNVANTIDEAMYQAMPYLKPAKAGLDKDKYDEYFKQLEEFTASLSKKKEQERGQRAEPGAEDGKRETETA